MSEVLTLRANKNMKEIIVKIPKECFNENEHTVVHQEPERGDFVYISTKRYVTDYESGYDPGRNDERLRRNVANQPENRHGMLACGIRSPAYGGTSRKRRMKSWQ